MPVLKDSAIWATGFDLTAQASEVTIGEDRAAVDVTTFGGGGSVELVGGLNDSSIDVMTFADQATWDAIADGWLDTNADVLVTSIPTPGAVGGAVGDICFSGLTKLLSNKRAAKVGDAALITPAFKVEAAPGVMSGRILAPKTLTSATGVATSTPLLVSGLSAAQRVYFGLHVFFITGDRTITATLQSDTVGFPSPTTVVTLGAVSGAVQSALGSAAGPVADTYWRTSYTIGGTTGSLQFAAFMAIA